MVGVDASNLGGDHRAGVVTDGPVAVIAQAPHQLRPGTGCPHVVPPALGRRAREAKARERRDHEVERRHVRRTRLGERSDHVKVLDDGAGPAVGEDERRRVIATRADVHEVDPRAVDLGDELGQRVELGLERSPIEDVAPKGGQPLHAGAGDAVVVPGAWELVRPAGVAQPLVEIIQGALGDIYTVGSYRGHGVSWRLSLQNGTFRSDGLAERNDPLRRGRVSVPAPAPRPRGRFRRPRGSGRDGCEARRRRARRRGRGRRKR
jgi:hypothetical protein